MPPSLRDEDAGVVFFVASDSHFGVSGIEAVHDRFVTRMNAAAAATAAEGPKPSGLLITGDLTEWGQPKEWDAFVTWYGLTGKEGRLRVPVFETWGNHDGVTGTHVRDQVAARHGGRRFYSFDFNESIHVLALGEAPDDEALAFAEQDLARHAATSTTPLVLFFHRALAGPWSENNWFADGNYRARLAALLRERERDRDRDRNRNVLAISHGHHHARGHYVWNGIDVYKPGAAKDGPHTFAIVKATCTTWQVTWQDADTGQPVAEHHKPIQGICSNNQSRLKAPPPTHPPEDNSPPQAH